MKNISRVSNKKNIEDKIVVCHLSNYAATFYGNFMASLFDLEKELITRNLSDNMVYVFYENAKNREWVKEMKKNKKIYFLKNTKANSFLAIKNILKSNNISHLHLHFCFPIVLIILLKTFVPGIKIIVHHHMHVPQGLGIKVKYYLISNIFVDMSCAVSNAVYTDLIQYRIKSKKLSCIDNGIVFSRLDISSDDGKNKYGVEKNNVLMIYGTQFYRKGVDIAINAVQDIVEKYNIILMIVCQNQDFVLEQVIKQLNHIPKWILIVPSQEDIALYFKMSNIYLTPSRKEAFSYALLESIYCGTPVIRSNYPGMDRGLPNDIVVSVDDIFSLQQKIEFVLSLDSDSKEKILSEQKKYVLQHWSIDIWTNKIINMYLDIIKADTAHNAS